MFEAGLYSGLAVALPAPQQAGAYRPAVRGVDFASPDWAVSVDDLPAASCGFDLVAADHVR
jgi:hypothetical protein